jgi:L-2,4-diaminobutyrate transaminase
VEDRAGRKFFDSSRKIGPAVAAALLKRGVIARAMPRGDIIGFAPPLCLTVQDADFIVSATVESVRDVFG